MKSVLVGLAAILVVAIAAILVLANGFSRQVARAEARLTAYPPGEIRTDLPPAVAAFAQRGMAGGTPGTAIRLTQAAEMRLKRGGTWSALAARQTIATPAPGFAWVAAMKAGPVPLARVIDSYVEGEGRLEVRALGALRIGLEAGEDAALGEAQRYVAELPWTPDAILTNRAIAWTETAEGVSARLDTPAGPAEIAFTFDAAGDIDTMRAEARPTTLDDGTTARLVWRGWFRDYAEIGGRRIPLQGEVGYEYPDGYESYWRGRITGFEVVAPGA